MYSAHKCQVFAGRRLKTMTNFKIVIPHGGGGRLREVPTVPNFGFSDQWPHWRGGRLKRVKDSH